MFSCIGMRYNNVSMYRNEIQLNFIMRNCIPVLVVVAAGRQLPVAAAAVAEQPGTACDGPKM